MGERRETERHRALVLQKRGNERRRHLYPTEERGPNDRESDRLPHPLNKTGTDSNKESFRRDNSHPKGSGRTVEKEGVEGVSLVVEYISNDGRDTNRDGPRNLPHPRRSVTDVLLLDRTV